MKLLSKQRDGARVSRRYAPAQTPLQRLRSAGKLVEVGWERLETLYVSLDPVRLRQQFEQLQVAVWQHAHVVEPDCTGVAAELRTPRSHLAFQHGYVGDPPTPTTATAGERAAEADPRPQKRKYYRTARPRVPHTWRTRPDPFVEVWDQVEEWLAADPTRTAKSLFQELQRARPDHFTDGQLRTLQRRVKAWRAGIILTFNAAWIDAEREVGSVLPEPLQARPAPSQPTPSPGVAASVSASASLAAAGTVALANL